MPGIESFGRRQRENERIAWETKLRGANFRWVRDSLAMMLQMAEGQINPQGEKLIFKTEFLDALEPFLDNPNLETAIALLKAQPSVESVFEDSKETVGRALQTDAVENQQAIQNARHIPVIESGIASIRLGVFTKLCQKFEQQGDPARAVQLAFCVTRELFCEPIEQADFQSFADQNEERIEQEVRRIFTGQEFAEPVLLAYAAQMIALGWKTGNPFNPAANLLNQRATENDAEIPNIVQMWGDQAIVEFFGIAQKFMVSSLRS